MIRVLLKKQMLEVFAWTYQDKKTGKHRTKKGRIQFGVLYGLIVCTLMGLFFSVAAMLCGPLVEADFGWLYMAIMNLLAVSLGVFGSVFDTFSTLYQAKDNELLLAMPIPTRVILVARLFGVFVMGVMYELFVMVPAIFVYWFHAPLNFWVVIFCLLLPLVSSLFVLALSCVIGMVLAVVNQYFKRRKLLTVVVALCLMAGYYYCCGNFQAIINEIVHHPEETGAKMKSFAYPLYLAGRAAEGRVGAMGLLCLLAVIICSVVYGVLHASFLRLATSKKGAPRVKYREKKVVCHSPDRALLDKEFRRFLGSATYMLNCGLGIVLMLGAAVALLIRQERVRETVFEALGEGNALIPLIAVAIICMTSTMNDMTAPSVSLEGKNIWMVQVLPVSGWQVLRAKLGMHMILTMIPVLALTASVEMVFQPSFLWNLVMPVAVTLHVLLMAMFGLVCNLQMPNLNWTSEMIPIKQGFSVIFVLLSGWCLVGGLSLAYFFLHRLLSPMQYLLVLIVVMLIADVVLWRWLKTRGSQIVESLH